MADLKMPDLNNVLISGRLTRDPDLKYTNNHNPVCSFAVAITRRFRTKDGANKDETTFVDCECWANLAEWVGTKIKKGAPVIVEGGLLNDSWEDKATGQRRTKLFIRARRVQTLSWDATADSEGKTSSVQDRLPEPPAPDEDIPF